MKSSINIQLHFFGLNANRRLREMVRPHLSHLQRLASISSVVVVLERAYGGPAFAARVHLTVPGPEIHAEARDQTLQAAWRKVCKSLERQIEQRKTKQVERVKYRRQQPISITSWSRPAARLRGGST
ncbi:MAG: HPF/RaiA family ribosome-associated protein [Verrucomicrobiales bacterium]|nr:HPF/RaiA family ribosome-associated protein [Verrucomicrobiales bacterium]